MTTVEALEARVAELEEAVHELAALSAASMFVRVSELHVAFPRLSRSQFFKLIRCGLIPVHGVPRSRIRVVAVRDVLKLFDDVKTIDAVKLRALLERDLSAQRKPRRARTPRRLPR